MNEFVAKKLGEVLAFSNLGVELFERGEAGLNTVFTDCEDVKEQFKAQAVEIEAAAEDGGVLEVTQTKAKSTGNKLRGMMETYIGDEWDNSAELLEWMGFFEGAAVVHWRLVEGAAESLEKAPLLELAQLGAQTHHDLLHRAQEAIKLIGKERGL